jgi:hypothetical protein
MRGIGNSEDVAGSFLFLLPLCLDLPLMGLDSSSLGHSLLDDRRVLNHPLQQAYGYFVYLLVGEAGSKLTVKPLLIGWSNAFNPEHWYCPG